MKNSNGTPSKETGTKNNKSDNDVDYKNSSKAENCGCSTSNKTSGKVSK